MNTDITLSHDEANQILNLLRFMQMHLGDVQRDTSPLQSIEFQGQLQQSIAHLEGDIHASGIIVMGDNGAAQAKEAAAIALEEFRHWQTEIMTPQGDEDFDRREQFNEELNVLVTLLRLAGRGAGPEPSAN